MSESSEQADAGQQVDLVDVVEEILELVELDFGQLDSVTIRCANPQEFPWTVVHRDREEADSGVISYR